MTKMTAMPMPVAVSTFLETPRKGQMPRKREKIKLLTRMAPSATENSSAPDIGYSPFFMIFWKMATRKPSVKKPPAGRMSSMAG